MLSAHVGQRYKIIRLPQQNKLKMWVNTEDSKYRIQRDCAKEKEEAKKNQEIQILSKKKNVTHWEGEKLKALA